MKMMMSNLPRDLVEEILSRVPLTCLKAVRSTCKNWNVLFLSKNRSFTIKHIGRAATAALREKEFLIVTEDCGVDLISINLQGINNNIDLSIKRKGTLINRDNLGQVLHISHVLNCNGLLVALPYMSSWDAELVVWNPYWGKKTCIKLDNNLQRRQRFALGYDKSSGSHKILKVFNHHRPEIYDLNSNSNSWSVLDATLDRNINLCAKPGVSLKGNTYWFVREDEQKGFSLLCFDFTRKRYGSLLPLPSHCHSVCEMSLTTVREEQLVVLLELSAAPEIEIWVTSKIEPDAVSWSCFLKVKIKRFFHSFQFGNFFIDEEKEVAVVLDKSNGFCFRRACIFGVNGIFRKVDLRESPHTRLRPLLCSYVPSCVQIK